MKEEKKQNNLISLKFSVTGKPATIDKVNIKQPLKVAVQKALNDTGSSRTIDEYDVLYDNNIIDITQKVETFGFPEDVVLMVSLKSGKGGK